jgi:hypothetical protein
MLLVDWEEHLGLGSEVSGPTQYHDGDGGMVAVFKDASNNTIAITGSDWKAQTFYTGPITDLTCPTENGTARLSSTCSTADNNNGSNYYGLHWARPASWTSASFNDTSWPNATTYTNATIGVNNKPAYTNFTNIFDDPAHDAQFIWSSNVILDNEVIVRYTVPAVNGVQDNKPGNSNIQIYPNPASNVLHITMQDVTKQSSISDISLYNSFGQKLMTHAGYTELLDLTNLPTGLYIVTIMTDGSLSTYKFIKE